MRAGRNVFALCSLTLLLAGSRLSAQNPLAESERDEYRQRIKQLEERLALVEDTIQTLLRDRSPASPVSGSAVMSPAQTALTDAARISGPVASRREVVPPELVPEIGKIGAEVGLGTRAQILTSFVDYVSIHCETEPVAAQLSIDWLAKYSAEHNSSKPSAHLSLVRQFLMHLSSTIPGTGVPDSGLFAAYRRPVPFLFTPEEVEALLIAADSAREVGSFKRTALEAILGLMACTGLRVSEVMKLNRNNVMPKDNPTGLVILETKFHKSRLVPLHSNAAKRMSVYAGHRELLGYGGLTPAFFVSDSGLCLTSSELNQSSQEIVVKLGIRPQRGSKKPTLRSLRHTFEVNRLRQWHEEKIEVRARLTYLATYLA